jgi:hypothetical protein
VQDHSIPTALDNQHLSASEDAAVVASEAEALLNHCHRRSLRADNALRDSDVILSTFDNPHTLWMGLIDHRREMRSVENGVVLRETFEHLEQVPLSGEVKVHPRLFK